MTASETEYLEASTTLESETVQRDVRRRRRVIVTLAAAVVVLATLGAFALAERLAAVEAANLAFAGELAAEARATVETDPELALLLALEAAQIYEAHGEPPSETAVTALRRGIRANRVEARLENGPFITVRPDGSQLIAETEVGGLLSFFSWRIEPTDPVTVVPEGTVNWADLGEWFQGPSAEYDEPTADHLAMTEELSSEPDRFLYSPDRTRLAAASRRTVGVLDLERQTIWERDDLDRVRTMTWSSDGGRLVVGGEGTLDVLDAHTGDLVRRVPGPLNGTNWLVSVPGSSLVAASDDLGEEILLIDVGDTGEFEIGGFVTPLEVWGMTITEDRLFASDLSSHLLADPLTGEVSVRREGAYDTPNVSEIAGMPTANESVSLVAGPDMDGQSTIWPSHGEQLYALPEDSRTTAIGVDGTLAVIDIENVGTQLMRIPENDVVADLATPGSVQRAWFSPDDGYVVVRSNQPSTTTIWEIATGELIAELTSPWSGLGLDFTPDGEYLILGTPEGLVSIFDFAMLVQGSTAGEALVNSIPAHNSLIVDLDVSPDGSTIISSALDQPAKLWDLESGQLLSEFGTRARTTVAFHPSRPWLYVAEGRTIAIHTLDIDELGDIARQRLTRDITADECIRYLREACETDS